MTGTAIDPRTLSVPPRVLETERLVLRPWQPSDLEPFTAINQDPEVIRYLGPPMDRDAVAGLIARLSAHRDRHGFGYGAVEEKATGALVGMAGLSVPTWEAHFTPCVEVGWRLARAHWGKGYATEAARAWLEFGFQVLGLEEIVSMTVPDNARSQAVMRRIGMERDRAGDFDHPRVAPGDPLLRHVLYRIRRDTWARG